MKAIELLSKIDNLQTEHNKLRTRNVNAIKLIKQFKRDAENSICPKCRKVYPKCEIRRRCRVIQCDDFLPYNKEIID